MYFPIFYLYHLYLFVVGEGWREASTVATVNGRIDLDPQQFRTCRCIGHHLYSADHTAGYADGVLAAKKRKILNYGIWLICG